jgi:hypothetical protein
MVLKVPAAPLKVPRQQKRHVSKSATSAKVDRKFKLLLF